MLAIQSERGLTYCACQCHKKCTVLDCLTGLDNKKRKSDVQFIWKKGYYK